MYINSVKVHISFIIDFCYSKLYSHFSELARAMYSEIVAFCFLYSRERWLLQRI